MDKKHILQILSAMGYTQQPLSVEPFFREEDGNTYNVWRILFPEGTRVLKAAKGCEAEIYSNILRNQHSFAPRIFASANVDGSDYLLMDYISGENLIHCNRKKLVAVLDSLIEMQAMYWQDTAHSQIGHTFENSLSGRNNRLNYLCNWDLEQIYREFLQEYASVPRTLCHDDLLPFNVIASETQAVFIDWEYGGILPYPVSLARLIAHGEEGENAFFYMTEDDKNFALNYYYRNFISNKGIRREVFDRTMALFLFYEYCEWVYLGNRFENADMTRFNHYYAKAKTAATMLMS